MASPLSCLVSRVAQAYSQKERFRTIQGFQRNVVLQSIANRYFPGARLKQGEFVGIDDDVTPFTMEMTLTAPRLLRPGDGVFLLKPLPQASMMVRSYGGKRERQHPFHLRSSRVMLDKIAIELSDSYRLERMPRRVVLATALGHSEWATDPRFTSNADRVENRYDIDRLIGDVIRTQTRARSRDSGRSLQCRGRDACTGSRGPA